MKEKGPNINEAQENMDVVNISKGEMGPAQAKTDIGKKEVEINIFFIIFILFFLIIYLYPNGQSRDYHTRRHTSQNHQRD
jgi:hypothetical protein